MRQVPSATPPNHCVISGQAEKISVAGQAEKLLNDGYSNVLVLGKGVEGGKNAGYPIE